MNKVKCADCVHMDVQFKYVNQKRKEIKSYALCAARSTYPHQEQDGQVFPPDAVRVEKGVLPKPVPIDPKGLVKTCTNAIRRKA